MRDLERAPCGCKMGTKGEAFIYEPCSPTCDLYAYAIEEARKMGKPIQVIDLSHSGQLPFAARCPYCAMGADGYTGNDTAPEPGDRSLCVYCARVGIYTEHGIRRPTAEEEAENASDHKLGLLVDAAKQSIRRRGAEFS